MGSSVSKIKAAIGAIQHLTTRCSPGAHRYQANEPPSHSPPGKQGATQRKQQGNSLKVAQATAKQRDEKFPVALWQGELTPAQGWDCSTL